MCIALKAVILMSAVISASESLEQLLKEHHEEIAALSIESIVQGASGMIVMPEGYLAGVREPMYNIRCLNDR